jgi:transposase
MPPFISNDLKARIPVLHYEQGFTVNKICSILNIRKTLAYETLRHHRAYGVAFDPNARRRGVQRRALTSTDLAFIRMLLNQQHTVYLDEIQDQLLSRRSVKVSIPTLTRTLRRLHFTHKDVSGKALERNDRLRAIYMNRIADLVPDPEMLMFGDEAHKDERTSNRRTGWSRRGTRCIQRKCFVRGRRFSMLPILTLDGIIAHDIIEGSVTSERFVEFLRELVVRHYALRFDNAI